MLRYAQRLEALGKLTGGIAHDFNNYLGIITANLECIQAGSRDAAKLRRYAENALTAASHGADLTRNLLAFARQQPLAPVRLDVNRLLHDFGSVLRPVADFTIDLAFDLASEVWPCEADVGELQNALVNLVVNACDAMPNGGQLTIRTRNVQAPEPYGDGDYVQLSITDTGHGMTRQVLQHAFDPFFTTKPAGKGTGLGLSMVYGFACQSGGHVVIDSAAGCGTTVHIRLPRALEPAQAERTEATRRERPEVANHAVR